MPPAKLDKDCGVLEKARVLTSLSARHCERCPKTAHGKILHNFSSNTCRDLLVPYGMSPQLAASLLFERVGDARLKPED